MKVKSILLASVAGAAVAPMANAADLPARAGAQLAPTVVAVPSWAGFYVGVNAGVAWHKARTNFDYYTDGKIAETDTGFIGGGQIGYNWQSGGAVFGFEADFSGLTGNVNKTQTFTPGGDLFTLHSDINWMATFRGRLGLAAGTNTLLYVTGGVAVADIKNKLTYSNFPGITWEQNKTKTGPVIGFGVEHMFAPSWTARLEGLLASFGKTSVDQATFAAFGNAVGTTKPTHFKNEVLVVRGALNYRF
jgi:outer membrane immunogenic protein